jgi:ketosteroid isomerase-like protein
MNSKYNARNSKRWLQWPVCTVLLLVFVLASAGTAGAQKKKKNKDESQPTPPPSVIASVPDEAKIDNAIGEMLGAWQVGNVEKMHENIADDVSVVAGTWTPPAVGWTNYLVAYQAQRARMEQVRLDRSNTLIRIAPSGLFAWACYQWTFSAVVDGSPSAAEGQTTLVLEKKGDKWLIVHNHTSLVQASQPVAPANAMPQPAQPTPAKP